MNTDLEKARQEEINHILSLAAEHGLKLEAGDITFAEGGRYPYIDNMDAEDWIEGMTSE